MQFKAIFIGFLVFASANIAFSQTYPYQTPPYNPAYGQFNDPYQYYPYHPSQGIINPYGPLVPTPAVVVPAELPTPTVTFQNDTDVIMTGGYTATVTNKNHQTRTLQDSFPIPPGTTTTPRLPYYLINQRIYITELFGNCPSSVIFNLEQRGGAFSIIEGSATGRGCPTPAGSKALVGTVLQDGFTILLLERPLAPPGQPQPRVRTMAPAQTTVIIR